MTRNCVTSAILVCIISLPVVAEAEDDVTLYKKVLEVASRQDPQAMEDYVKGLTLQELLSIGQQACAVEGKKGTPQDLLGASFMVNLSLQSMKKMFPTEVLSTCLEQVQKPERDALWRQEVLRWLGSAYSKKDASPEDVKRIYAVCNRIISAKEDNTMIRCRAIKCATRILRAKTRGAYSRNSSYKIAMEKNVWDEGAAMKAAIAKGFSNPWEDQLMTIGKDLQSILKDADAPKEIHVTATDGLGQIVKVIASDKVRGDIGETLHQIALDDRYDCTVLMRVFRVLIEDYGDISLPNRVEAVLARAKKVNDKASIERGTMLLQSINARQAASSQPVSTTMPAE